MVKLIFGGVSLSDFGAFNTQDKRAQVIDVLLSHNITHIDTARGYAGSEVAIGQLEKRKQFTIDTKIVGGWAPGTATKDAVIKDSQDSLEQVKIDQFNTLYIHAPDPLVPIEETLEGFNEVYKKGIFRQFGLSNFSAEQVEQVYDICKEKGYPLPKVYQGNYNPIARHVETLLFPTLRKLGIDFIGYSPLAGGFLTKTAKDLDAGAGRFNEQFLGGLYTKLYDNETMRQALIKWNEVAEKEGVSNAELAYRWVMYHGALQDDKDALLFGASSINQIEQTMQGFKKGKLSEEAIKGIDSIWESVKKVSPVNNFHGKVEQ